MYSPKIREEYIPVLYRIAKARGVPMTQIVAEALDAYLSKPDMHDEPEMSDQTPNQTEDT